MPYLEVIPCNKEKYRANLYYEIKGEGPEHVVFIMGYASPGFGWFPQINEITLHKPQYSILYYDHPGVGKSQCIKACPKK